MRFVFIMSMSLSLDVQTTADKLEEKIWKSCPHRAVISQLEESVKDLQKIRKSLKEHSTAETNQR